MSGYHSVKFTLDDESHMVPLKKVKGEGLMGLFAQEIFDVRWYDRNGAPTNVHLTLTALDGQAMKIQSRTQGVVLQVNEDDEGVRQLEGSRSRSYTLRFEEQVDDSGDPIVATVRLSTSKTTKQKKKKRTVE